MSSPRYAGMGASPGGAPNFSDLAGQNLEQMGIQPPPNDAPQEPVQQAPTVVAKPVRIPSKHRPDTPPTDLPSPKYPTLVEAAMAGDVADVENHILRGEDLDGRNARGYTALHCAAESGYLPVLELLLDYGVKLDLDAEACLRHANAKFERRFNAVEALFAAEGRGLAETTLQEMDAAWDAVKQTEVKS